MLLSYGVGDDSWESLGLQGDPTYPFWRRSALGFLWKEWCYSWNSSTLATSCEVLTHWKRVWCLEGLGAGEKGTTEDEMAGWHHGLHGRESEWTAGVAIHGVAESRTRLSEWTELNWKSPVKLRQELAFILQLCSSYCSRPQLGAEGTPQRAVILVGIFTPWVLQTWTCTLLHSTLIWLQEDL